MIRPPAGPTSPTWHSPPVAHDEFPEIVSPADADALMLVLAVRPSPVVTSLPDTSWICRIGATDSDAPDPVVAASTAEALVTTTLLAGPWVSVTALDWVAAVSEPEVKRRVYDPMTPRIPRPLKVTTPFVG